MKIDDQQELKPVYIHEARYSDGDEIGIIDLAMVLVHRKVLIAVIFMIFIASGVAVALYTPKAYSYSLTIEIGSQIINGSVISFESPQALLAKLKHSYIPKTLSKHRQSHPDDKNKYKIKSSVPSGSNITLLEINGTKDQEDTIKELLQTISQYAIADHDRIFKTIKIDLEARLNQTKNELKSLKNSNNNATDIMATQNIESLASQIANLRMTREVMPPMRSLDPIGSSQKTNIIIFAFAGIFLGIFTAFFTEFVSKVQQRIDEEDKA